MAKSPEEEHPKKAFGWAARDTAGVFFSFKFSRRATGEKDVAYKVLYCGICHTDLHNAKNEWGRSISPLSLGICLHSFIHEIVDEVTEVGSKVQKFKVGDRNHDGTMTYGGYSDTMFCEEDFIIHVPDNMPLDAAAPLRCAGITVYSSMKHYGLDKPGLHVGMAGLGRLGHVVVKFGKAMGMKITVISTSPNTKDEALKNLGADSFLVSREEDQLKAAVGTLDGIIDTVSAQHPMLPLFHLLKTDGKLILVGLPEKRLEISAFALVKAKHNVKPGIEVIAMIGTPYQIRCQIPICDRYCRHIKGPFLNF
ncbi:hypothetical protein CXB51_031581 [Gossypium anomalum]|uniref:Enoyl reductase (ER) domain-containing protein n=1 Tax=Gossypium anomalum TaxID=47600 RepID=A0A8J5Y0Y3_9ROSI|nr:hypothetical protein CXB51_031581 [Gossypium anomalum]